MFTNQPAADSLVSVLKTVSVKDFAKDLSINMKTQQDSSIAEYEAKFSYGGYELGNSTVLYRKDERTMEVTGFYPFQHASQLQGRHMAILFYGKLMNRLAKVVSDQVMVIPNRINSSEYIAFLDRLGINGRANIPFSVLVSATIQAYQVRAKNQNSVL